MRRVRLPRRALVALRSRREAVGDVFLLYSRTRRRFIHTGIVVGVQDEDRVHERDMHVCVTVEGNTNDDGSANGYMTLRKPATMLGSIPPVGGSPVTDTWSVPAGS